VVYLDTSALVKLVVAETESAALRRWLGRSKARRVTSDLARVELERAVRASGAPERVVEAARALFDGLAMASLGREVLDRAGTLQPTSLRTLDSIHLATALLLGADTTVLTYDDRLASAARAIGLAVATPA
jgi:predicted nucleic acid-binding protein